MTTRIAIVGAGAVGRTLARALLNAGWPADLAHARDGSAQHACDAAGLVMLTVPDDAIAAVCASLRWRPGQSVVHCSGATEVSALETAHGAGAAIGGFHPLQMFANPDVALAGLPGCGVAIEAAEPLRSRLHALAHALGLVPFDLPPGVRARYHASATFVGPFVIAVIQEAVLLWQSFGLGEDQAIAALRPLLQGTLNAVDARGLAGGMGGCVARGDVGTVERHLRALDAHSPKVGALYRDLTRLTIPLAIARGSLTGEKAREIAACLDAPQR